MAETTAPLAGVRPAELTARLAVYPGAMLRPVPSFVFSVPRGWLLDEAADALAVIRTPEEIDGFWVNAIISHDRVPRAVDFEAAAKTTWARIKQSSPDASPTLEKMARFGTNVAYLRGVELTAPKSGRKLAQLHALFFAPAEGEGKTVDFFQIVGTSPADVMERVAPAFLEIIGSFRFA
jgi:hypothetical protein